MKNRSIFAGVSLSLALACSSTAMAAETSSSFGATSSVVASCQIEKYSDVDLGTYNPLSPNEVFGEGKFGVKCTKGTTVRLLVDQGVNALAGSTCAAPQRSMASEGNNRLAYSMLLWWDEAAISENAVCDMGTVGELSGFLGSDGEVWNGSSYTHTFMLYTTVPAGQNVSTGAYSDTVTVSVVF